MKKIPRMSLEKENKHLLDEIEAGDDLIKGMVDATRELRDVYGNPPEDIDPIAWLERVDAAMEKLCRAAGVRFASILPLVTA